MTGAREYDEQSLTLSRAWPLMWRAIRLRCPNCGGKGIFQNWFKLRDRCPTCGLRFDRAESDYFIGAYLFNLIAVELLVAALIVAVAVLTWPDPPWGVLQWAAVALVLAGAFICYPFAQTTWLAFDLMLRPVTPEEMQWYRDGGGPEGRDLPQL
jgi:uncharacterized protein (DUF983 family)